MEFPNKKRFNFGYPGIPSIFILYDRTNDLFYSGHAGILFYYLLATICVIRKKKCIIFVFLLYIYTIFMLLTLSAHYLNDIIIGTIVSFCIFYYNNKYRYSIYLLFCNLLTLKYDINNIEKEI